MEEAINSLNAKKSTLEEIERTNSLAKRIKEEFDGDVVYAIKQLLKEHNPDDAAILFELLADEAFSILSEEDYDVLCNNVLDNIDDSDGDDDFDEDSE